MWSSQAPHLFLHCCLPASILPRGPLIHLLDITIEVEVFESLASASAFALDNLAQCLGVAIKDIHLTKLVGIAIALLHKATLILGHKFAVGLNLILESLSQITSNEQMSAMVDEHLLADTHGKSVTLNTATHTAHNIAATDTLENVIIVESNLYRPLRAIDRDVTLANGSVNSLENIL